MKRFVAVFCTLLIIFSSTIAVAVSDRVKAKRGDEFLKESLDKWEEVGNESVIDMFGEFIQKGFPTLSRADAKRLAINIMIFSCIANVGIVIFILKKDKSKEETALDPKVNSFHEIDKERSKLILNVVKSKHPDFDEKLFMKKVKELFEKHFEQMQNEVDDGMEHHIEKAKVRDIEFVRYFNDEDKEKLVVVFKVEMIEYWADANAKLVEKGSNKAKIKAWFKSTIVMLDSEMKIESLTKI